MTEIPTSAARAASEIRAVFSRLRRRMREVADLGDLTPSQTSVLSRLEREGTATASELAAAERVRPQSMAATLAAIQEAGLIQRAADPADGRRQVISLTETGRDKVHGSRQQRDEWLARTLATQFTEEERQTVIAAFRLLDRLVEL